jgi:hypothetical protein
MAASLGTLHKRSTAAVLDRLERDADTIARRMALATQAEV